MGEQTWTFISKSKWGPGPWQDEPDKAQWTDESTGFTCLAVRHKSSGHWCGYVGLPPDHRLSGADYDDVRAQVHGGLTYADFCQENDREHGICHVAAPGEPDRLYWLGFDCAHAGDFSPGYRSYGFVTHETYKTLDYVKAQCAGLARQLKGPVDGN